MVRRDQINEDPDLVPFFTSSHSFRWIGEKRHIIVRSLALVDCAAGWKGETDGGRHASLPSAGLPHRVG